jgi:glucose/arabinose dehydrogenase
MMKKTNETTISSSFASILVFSKINLIAIFNSLSLLVVTLTFILIENFQEDYFFLSPIYAAKTQSNTEGPTIDDPNLVVQQVYQGLKSPTAMAFIASNDILVLEKDEGTVQRIVNGKILQEPLLQVVVDSKDERGMLGIAIATKDAATTNIETEARKSPINVFLFFTEAKVGDFPMGNRVYKYELVDDNTKLANPKLLLNLPALPDDSHVGGVVSIGPDNNVYIAIGDQRPTAFNRLDEPESHTKAQNYVNGIEPDGRSGILRITQDGEIVGGKGILGDSHPLNKYYAYGIKNSFGLDFDPITDNLWDTENGPSFGDEINLVEAGFNSGWANIQGYWALDDEWNKGEEVPIPLNAEDYNLVDFGGKGQYSSPEFTWDVAPTALKFLNSDKLGKEYENDMFVGDIKNGNLYHFELDKQRTGLLLDGPLADKVASNEEINQTVFAQGFGGITDVEVGPDGYLYILTFGEEDGTIYKIVPITNGEKEPIF